VSTLAPASLALASLARIRRARRSLAGLIALGIGAIAGEARADPPSGEPSIDPSIAPAAAPERDAEQPAAGDPFRMVRRPWLYAADPSAPPPGHVLASLSVGYAEVNRGAARPFAGNIAHAGGVLSAGGEVGVLRFASLHAEGLLAGDGGKVNAGAMIGASFYPLPATFPVTFALSGGYLRELGGDSGAWGRASVGGDLGKARLVLTALGSHVFAPGTEKRDGVDLLLTAGASYALGDIVRVGAEYVVQDLEGAWDPDEAEGGIRHFLSPMASLTLAKHVYINGGPAFGLSKESPRVLGRIAATYAF
jgi:hypothetical protein